MTTLTEECQANLIIDNDMSIIQVGYLMALFLHAMPYHGCIIVMIAVYSYKNS